MATIFFNEAIPQIKLSYFNPIPFPARKKADCADTLVHIFRSCWDMDTIELSETVKVVLMNTAFHVLGIFTVSQGGITSCTVDVRTLFASCLLAGATHLALCHNHPSGNPYPSQADTKFTKKVKAAGELLDITLLDHIIITREFYYSFADEGLL